MNEGILDDFANRVICTRPVNFYAEVSSIDKGVSLYRYPQRFIEMDRAFIIVSDCHIPYHRILNICEIYIISDISTGDL